MIDKQTIEERKKTITNDILTVKERLSEYEKKKVEDVALINALTGALQQCDYFLWYRLQMFANRYHHSIFVGK